MRNRYQGGRLDVRGISGCALSASRQLLGTWCGCRSGITATASALRSSRLKLWHDPQPPHVSAHVEAGCRLVSVGLVVGVRGCPVPGHLERGDDIADGPGVRAEGVVTGVGAVAALEVPPHDPVVEHEAVRAGQHQVGGFGAGQPADVLPGLDVDRGAGVLPPQVVRQGLGHDPDPAYGHAACGRGADDVEVVAPVVGAGVAGRLPFGEPLLGLVVGVPHLEADHGCLRGGQQLGEGVLAGALPALLVPVQGVPDERRHASRKPHVRLVLGLADVLVEFGDERRVGDGLAAEHEVSRLRDDEHRRAFAGVGFGVAADEVRHCGPPGDAGVPPRASLAPGRLVKRGKGAPDQRACLLAAHRDRVQLLPRGDVRGDLVGMGERQETRQHLDGHQVRVGDVEGFPGPVAVPVRRASG